MSNKAVILERPEAGQKPNLAVKDIGKPSIGHEDVLVRMKLMPINPSGAHFQREM